MYSRRSRTLVTSRPGTLHCQTFLKFEKTQMGGFRERFLPCVTVARCLFVRLSVTRRYFIKMPTETL